ncbi:MAG TPA: collagen-binding domain-containing protein [Vicinamibacterales bacterium]|nr:collagen-binding domain-containing protein [Vicinamibacterales bacterium]
MNQPTRSMNLHAPSADPHHSERGVALVVVLLLTIALSAIGASLLLLAKTDTYTSMNYRMMSQARYGAESGVMRAANYLTQVYQDPGQVTGDPLANYNMTVSPVTYNGQPVVLSADPNKASNYPYAPAQAAFSAAVQGSLVQGQTVNYTAYATLLSMRTVQEYGATTPRVIQTWRLTGTGSIGGARPATVEVTSTLEQQIVPIMNFGLFATSSACGALEFSGGATTSSYDSSNITMQNGQPVTQNSGGSVGSNGNLNVSGGQTQINGSLSTPRTGVGNCKNGTVTAFTGNVATVTEGIVQLPQAMAYPTPALPNPLPPTTGSSWDSCASLGLSAPTCTGSAGNITLDPQGGTLTFGDVSIGNNIVHLKAGLYNINSITSNANATLYIDNGPVVMNVAGQSTNQPISLNGNGFSNPSYDPTNFQILYGGTSAININGSSTSAAMLYAPNAAITFNGGADFYGSMVGATIKDTGGAKFHYDRRLQNDFMMGGAFMMSSFTWRKY